MGARVPRRWAGTAAPAIAAALSFQALSLHAAAAATPEPRGTARYIVTLDPGASPAVEDRARGRARTGGGAVHRTYQRALRGFSASLTPAAVRELQLDESVRSVEPDGELRLSGVQSPAPWGLDRIDQRGRAPDGAYGYGAAGAGVSAFVVDGGIRADHAEFGGRVSSGFSTVGDGLGTGDCGGHGTHVAGILGGATYGVAKVVTLVPVRVFDCAGLAVTSDVIAGLDWVTAHQVPGRSVVNLSAGGPPSSALDAAVANTVAAGIPVVVAAGNENADACGGSPARAPAAVTVGASTSADGRASFSNFGPCVDLFAPGAAIPSAWHTSPTATAVLHGTSMAAPHVAGAIALALQATTAAPAAAVTGALDALTTRGALSGTGPSSPNRLLFAPPHYRLAGASGSTTGQFLAALGADPGALAVNGLRQVDAFAPFGTSTVTTQDAASYPGCTIARPPSAGAARAALVSSLGAGAGCLQFAGAESLDLSPASPRLVYVPMARDSVTYAITATSNLPKNLTSGQLRDVFGCRAVAAWRPMLPAAGTGLREFWIGWAYPGGLPSPRPACLQDGVDESGAAIPANAGAALNNNEIVPYSVAQWAGQTAGVAIPDFRSDTRIGQIDGHNPFAANFVLQRDLYTVVPESALSGASLTDHRVRTVFAGPSSLACQAMNGPIARRFGFRAHPGCGSTSLRTP